HPRSIDEPAATRKCATFGGAAADTLFAGRGARALRPPESWAGAAWTTATLAAARTIVTASATAPVAVEYPRRTPDAITSSRAVRSPSTRRRSPASPKAAADGR